MSSLEKSRFLTMFMSDMQSKDPRLVSNAAEHFLSLASFVGPDITTNEILEFITRIVSSLNHQKHTDSAIQSTRTFLDSSLLIKIVEVLNKNFLETVGLINFPKALNVLKEFASFPESQIRTKSVESIKSYFDVISNDPEMVEAMLNLTNVLCLDDTVAAKLSAIDLIQYLFQNRSVIKFDPRKQSKFLTFLIFNAKKGSLDVQKQSCDTLVEIIQFLDEKDILNRMIPSLKSLLKCDDPQAKSSVVPLCLEILKHCKNEKIMEFDFVSCLKRCATNSSWHLMGKFAEHFVEIWPFVQSLEGSESLPLKFISLSEVEEPVVFSTFIRNLPEMLKLHFPIKSQDDEITEKIMTFLEGFVPKRAETVNYTAKRVEICKILPILCENYQNNSKIRSKLIKMINGIINCEIIVEKDIKRKEEETAKKLSENNLSLKEILKFTSSLYKFQNPQEFVKNFLPAVQNLSIDDNWRFRAIAFESVTFIGSKMNEKEFTKCVFPLFLNFMTDRSIALREKCLDAIHQVGLRFGNFWLVKNVVSFMIALSENGNDFYRKIPISFLEKYGSSLNNELINDHFVEIVLKLSEDKVENLSERAIKVVRKLIPIMTENNRNDVRNRLFI